MTDDHPKTDLDNDNLSFHDMQDKCDTPLVQHHRHRFSQRMGVLMKLRPLDVRKSLPQTEQTNPRNGMSSASNLKIERYVCDLLFDKIRDRLCSCLHMIKAPREGVILISAWLSVHPFVCLSSFVSTRN